MGWVRKRCSTTAEDEVLDAIHLLAGVIMFVACYHYIDPILLEKGFQIISHLLLVASASRVIGGRMHEDDLPGAFVVGAVLQSRS